MFEGATGLLAGMAEGKVSVSNLKNSISPRVSHRHAYQVWIDHSTTDHEQNKVFAEALSKSGGSLLEAPITGGLEALKKGQMAVWVAGDKVMTLF